MIHLLRFLTAMSLFLAVFTAEAGILLNKGLPYVAEPLTEDVSIAQTVCAGGLRLYSGLQGLEYTGVSATEPQHMDEEENRDILVMQVAGTTSTSGVIVRECAIGFAPNRENRMQGIVVIHKGGITNGTYKWVMLDDNKGARVIVEQHFEGK